MVRRLLSRPVIALLSCLIALAPAAALADPPGKGQPFGIDWTPIVFWVLVGGVMLLGLLLGLLIDWGNR
jgi:peptidoglycan/LPS O-acetylase OafA/YrhL